MTFAYTVIMYLLNASTKEVWAKKQWARQDWMAMQHLRQLVAGFSPLRFRFAPRAVHVGFIVYIVTKGQASLRVLRSSSVSIITPLPYIYPSFIWRMNNGPVSNCISTEI
jgi:hypothetical protein